jgi:hypothetical protein
MMLTPRSRRYCRRPSKASGNVAALGLTTDAGCLALCDEYFSAHIGVDGTEIVVVAGMVEVLAVT